MKFFFQLLFCFILFESKAMAQSIASCQNEIKLECSSINSSDEGKIVSCLSKKSNIIEKSNPSCYQYLKNRTSKMQNDCAIEIRRGCMDNPNGNYNFQLLFPCLHAKKNNSYIISNPSCAQVLSDILRSIQVAKENNTELSDSIFSRIALPPVVAPVVVLSPKELAEKNAQQARLKACSRQLMQEISPNCSSCSVLDLEVRARSRCRSYAEMELSSEIRMCIFDVLGNLKYKTRGYYDLVVESYNICRLISDGPKEQKDCFNKRENRGFLHAKNEYQKCDPKIKSCMDTFEKELPSTNNVKRQDIYLNYCRLHKDKSTESIRCMAEILSKGDTFLNHYSKLRELCEDRGKRICIDRLEEIKNIKNISIDEYFKMLSVCRRADSLNKSEIWIDCVYAHIDKNKITIDEAESQCNKISQRAQTCLKKCTAKKIDYQACIRDICSYTSEPIQDCLINLRSPSSANFTIRNQGDFWFCSLENKEQKSCYLALLKEREKKVKTVLSENDARSFASICRKDHKDFSLCIDDYTDYFQKYRYNPNATRDLGILICEVPIKEVRECLLESLMVKDSHLTSDILFTPKQFRFDRRYNDCHRVFLSNLITQFQNENKPQWHCRYSEFENKSLFEQNQECLKKEDFKICNKFISEILPEATLEILKKECLRLKTVPVGSKGPLQKECLKRALEH